MEIKRLDISLPSLNLKETLQFYTDALHFTKVWDFSEYCTVALGTAFLHFVPAASENIVRAYQTDYSLISFHVDGIAGLYEKVNQPQYRVKFVRGLELTAPGVWVFSIRDNNDYHIGFSESTGPNR